MKRLTDFKEEIHKCSKCGLCQAECPIYGITGNDCSVSRGQFIMLKGILDGNLKMSKIINHYLDLCLKCGKCSDFCPSGVDAVDIIISAKYEYFRTHLFPKILSFLKKYIIFGFIPWFESLFKKKYKSKTFDKKVLYFGGCASKFRTARAVTKILNSLNIEVIDPVYPCCGISLLMMGDLDGFKKYITNFVKICKKYDLSEIITTCTSCEKTLKSYIKWADNENLKDFLSQLKITNIYSYIRENNFTPVLNNSQKVTYHKPCSLENWEDVKWILENTENLNYTEMENYDKCCGLNGIDKFSQYKILKQIFKSKRDCIIDSKADVVLSSCLGCDTTLKLYSFGKYKVCDLIEFIGNNIQN